MSDPLIPQPAPTRSDAPAAWDLVLADMKARDAAGRLKYGTALQPFNGRDALIDAYQEALDLCVYLRQAIYERDAAPALAPREPPAGLGDVALRDYATADIALVHPEHQSCAAFQADLAKALLETRARALAAEDKVRALHDAGQMIIAQRNAAERSRDEERAARVRMEERVKALEEALREIAGHGARRLSISSMRDLARAALAAPAQEAAPFELEAIAARERIAAVLAICDDVETAIEAPGDGSPEVVARDEAHRDLIHDIRAALAAPATGTTTKEGT